MQSKVDIKPDLKRGVTEFKFTVSIRDFMEAQLTPDRVAALQRCNESTRLSMKAYGLYIIFEACERPRLLRSDIQASISK